LANVKRRFTNPATTAVELCDLFPSPVTAAPVASVTAKLTTGGLLTVTPVTVIFGSSARQAATDADVAVVALDEMVEAGVDGFIWTTVLDPSTPSLPPPQPNNADEISAVSPSRISVRFI
jgi:uncharacterized membrane protein